MHIVTEIKERLGIIRINRPEARNALTPDMIRQITFSMGQLEDNQDISLIAITGADKGTFAAGCDISVIHSMDARGVESFIETGKECTDAIERCPKPVIALVDGYALGGGFEIVLACDIVFASENASFGFPEVKLGLIPGFGGTESLPKWIGLNRAKEMIFTGRIIDAMAADKYGLINRLVKSGDLEKVASKIAEEISSVSIDAIAGSKRVLNCIAGEREEFMRLFESRDSKEGLAAFLEKRCARFL